jgi:SAF domain
VPNRPIVGTMTVMPDKAARVAVRRWRDPRLWIGVTLVVLAVLLGARVLAGAGGMTDVSFVARDVVAGSTVGPGDLATTRVHFDDDATEVRYFAAGQAPPLGARAARDLSAGELLARSDLVTTGESQLLELPLGVDPSGMPAGLQRGDHVDVWAVRDGPGKQGDSRPVAVDVVVLAAGTDSVPTGSGEQVLVGLPDRGSDVAAMLDELHGADVVLVRHGR